MATAPGQNFTKAMDSWAHLAAAQLDALARQSIQELAERVVLATPVDTAFLRGSWQPSIGGYDMAAVGSPDAGGARVMSQTGIALSGLPLGETFYLVNNAVYAMRLEYGFVGEDSLGRYYNQAGRHFVGNAIVAWESIVAKTAAELGAK